MTNERGKRGSAQKEKRMKGIRKKRRKKRGKGESERSKRGAEMKNQRKIGKEESERSKRDRGKNKRIMKVRCNR